jgi:hypothetical protein
VDANHQLIVKNFEEEVNNSMKNPLENNLQRKRHVMSANAISNFLGAIHPYKKDNVHPKDFMKILGLLIIKYYLPIQFVENI